MRALIRGARPRCFADDPQYIARLVGQVTRVSVETVKIIRALPPLGLDTHTG